MSAQIVECTNCGKKNRVPAVADGVPRCGNCHSPLPWPAEAGDGDFAEIAEKADLPVLVDFWAPWCGPCRFVSPVLDQIAREMAGRIKLVKVNVDDSQGLAERFTVRHIPTLMIMRRGEVVDRRPGATSAADMRAWVEAAVNRSATPR
ncbi:thioredoxin [Actinomadura barringtoniae]|uniref:Thioredoxin n=1 Tax=Actinomadura barringtoniae TaxID=1427535 RepID=A0A939PHG6_9ACTN|nr:thioredoxin [Actinomadura barringtoniae]MBO2448621.1 thioredoxin [Actinomadura barringtoniae]